MFKRISGKARLEWYPKAASTAISYGALIQPDGSGATIAATSSSLQHLGVSLRAVVSTDADYATAGAKIPLDVIGEDDVFEVDVTGTLTTAMVGTHLDLSDSLTVNAAGTSHLVVLCVGFISATKGLFKVNARSADKQGS